MAIIVMAELVGRDPRVTEAVPFPPEVIAMF
jgi:hypothetical protein